MRGSNRSAGMPWRLALMAMTALGILILGSRLPTGHHGIAAAQTVKPAVAATQADSRIEISKHKYSRPTLTVPVGTTVTWVNHDEDVHTVVSRTQAFTSRGMDTDETFSFTFAKPGVYEYFCTLHPLMTGKVIVK
jgi:plastocyanin